MTWDGKFQDKASERRYQNSRERTHTISEIGSVIFYVLEQTQASAHTIQQDVYVTDCWLVLRLAHYHSTCTYQAENVNSATPSTQVAFSNVHQATKWGLQQSVKSAGKEHTYHCENIFATFTHHFSQYKKYCYCNYVDSVKPNEALLASDSKCWI